jgi:hypothetical protein
MRWIGNYEVDRGVPEEGGNMKRFVWLVMVILILMVGIGRGEDATPSNTSFNGGTGGIFSFDDEGRVRGWGYPIGATYRPDIIDEEEGTLTAEVSRLIFFTDQVIRDGLPDLNFTGMGVSIIRWSGVEFIGEGAAIFNGFPDDEVYVGAYGGLRMPFRVMKQKFQFKVGGGWDGQNPILVTTFNFVTGW